jgi:hypothetical protein
MKQQDKRSLLKANSTTKHPNTFIEEELSNNKFQKTIPKMINYLKEETKMLVLDLKEDMSKQLNDLKENTNR